jgi:hypothetical protein
MSKGERSNKIKLSIKNIFYQIEKNISDMGRKGMETFLFYIYVSLNDKGGDCWNY